MKLCARHAPAGWGRHGLALAGLCALALACGPVVPARAEGPREPVRVGLFSYAPVSTLAVSSDSGGLAVMDGTTRRLAPGRSWQVKAQGERVLVGARLTGRLALQGAAPWRLTLPDGWSRRFVGELALSARGGRLLVVLRCAPEAYVASCVAAEMAPDWPAEALAAQAIASRSFLRYRRDRHPEAPYDVCDSTHCQRFRGLAGADARAAGAAERTEGLVLAHHGRAAEALWHAACGGHTAPNEAIFGGSARPYLRGVADRRPDGRAWCEASPYARGWRARLAPERLASALGRAGLLGAHEPLSGLAIADADADGWVLRAEIRGRRPRFVSGYALWLGLGPSLGWGAIGSPRFALAHAPDGQTVFSGRGLGHGVGLCQWGACARARAGADAAAILKAYFPETALMRLPS